ncbi:unnamed protein product [Bursaphelenchus okinawaensis]|uniref:DAGKc domain-containing protein n=1 Tax=Bursaphelenchus okinawaensis TaxID=465554 RepID=A0A811KCG8_9BILA|nr:unnamed protein product [Bursaphelenchus okinawaensis]CAG9098959.1 unnamed protein product [Bursaphelenchus okinawaensis]
MSCCRFLGCSKCCRKNEAVDEVVDLAKSSFGRVLIFVNPASGAGMGSRIYLQTIRPELQAKKMSYETIVTEHQNHAAKVLSERNDLRTFDAIVIASGDGLVFEALNAILSRHDAESLLESLPLYIIPCGSGNGLLASVCHQRKIPIVPAKELLKAATEALTYKYAISLPVTLMHCRTSNKQFGASLSVGWGLMADIDIESEVLRPLCGSSRFTVGALWRILCLRNYRARLSFLPLGDEQSPTTSKTPNSVYEQKDKQLSSIREEEDLEYSIWKDKLVVEEPEMDAPVPHGWRVIEDEFINVYAVTRSHISTNCFFGPDAQLDQATIHLCYILKRDVTSKAQIAKFLAAMEKGEHLTLPFAHYTKVKALRLETLAHQNHRSPIVVDGEVIPDCTQIQCVSSTLAMRVATK